MLKFDENELALVAAILEDINPGPTNKADNMRYQCEKNIEPGKPTVLSCGGWVASCYIDWEGYTCVRFSLAAYTMAVHLNDGTSPYQPSAKYKVPA